MSKLTILSPDGTVLAKSKSLVKLEKKAREIISKESADFDNYQVRQSEKGQSELFISLSEVYKTFNDGELPEDLDFF